jgi:toxin YoeB
MRINVLIKDVRRDPFRGIGKPEALKGVLSGWWSRRITSEHRLVYRVEAKPGTDQRIEIAMCRTHYA